MRVPEKANARDSEAAAVHHDLSSPSRARGTVHGRGTLFHTRRNGLFAHSFFLLFNSPIPFLNSCSASGATSHILYDLNLHVGGWIGSTARVAKIFHNRSPQSALLGLTLDSTRERREKNLDLDHCSRRAVRESLHEPLAGLARLAAVALVPRAESALFYVSQRTTCLPTPSSALGVVVPGKNSGAYVNRTRPPLPGRSEDPFRKAAVSRAV
ncbi:hypothetical protein CCUS01_04364 [Colletotrichum cuscutae]|uniref:Uncharacterized protein n=1 Tax=Colletotrichum cuscutae TaxID=1209917 RepID=A0AAI9VDI6_9PEZI|nr:hypothetical protein CCUS01_04364 [Colletotrichum cuscutae]